MHRLRFFEDVTAHMKTQHSLIESEEQLKMAQQIAHLGSWEYNVKEDRAVWSEELFRIFGLQPKEFGPSINEYLAKIYPEDNEAKNKSQVQMLSQRSSLSRASFDYRYNSARWRNTCFAFGTHC
jgi:PAS domain-containing protein